MLQLKEQTENKRCRNYLKSGVIGHPVTYKKKKKKQQKTEDKCREFQCRGQQGQEPWIPTATTTQPF